MVAGETRLAGRLPAEVTSFVGRRRELAEARRLLSARRLLTLTGPGGVGKTRLALRVVDQVRRAFPDGVYLAELDALDDPTLLPQTVAVALGLRDASDDPVAALAEYVADMQLLVVLDNCEHVADTCAVLVDKLLAMAPGLRILATSRHVLGIEGEQILPVAPLPVPGNEDVGATAAADAIELFAERAAAVLPGFHIDDGNRDRVLQICQRLDGLPLAIELAAVRLRALSLDDILDRLNDRFGLLVEGSRTAPERQRTLGGALGWSYALCSAEERLVWARLSCFVGTFGLDAAEEVGSGGGIDRDELLGLIAGLVDKSILVRQANSHGRSARYRMIETIRRYGQVRLEPSREGPDVRARHLAYYRALALRYQATCFGPEQLAWNQRMQAEHANLRAALEFGLSGGGDALAALDIAAALWNFWFAAGFLREGLRWLQRGLLVNPALTRSRAEALWTCALLSVYCGEGEAGQRLLDECAVLAEYFGDTGLRAHVAECAGQAALFRGELAAACRLLEAAVAGHRAAGNLIGITHSLIMLAAGRVFQGDRRGSGAAAEALELCEAHGAAATMPYALWAVAVYRWRAGEYAEGAALAQHAIRVRPAEDWAALANQLELLAWCSAGLGRMERVGRLLGGARVAWRRSGARNFEASPYRAIGEQVADEARARIGDEAFDAAVASGRLFGIEQAIAYALEEPPPAHPPEAAAPASVGGLTRREREIAELVAEGLSNKEIAASLTIARRTAEGHVERILTKLGFTSRAQIAAWVAGRRGGG
ncbi:MAG: LuxR family transcriptional regulator fused with ATPase domain [Pseudonocardiales bacterium]|nr:LuxR family transcriptional regulator fused with ATPase domain [Pseudonocardiales bacterium]